MRKKNGRKIFIFSIGAQPDRVTISEEARTAWANTQTDSKQSEQSEATEPAKMSASEEFAAYMKSKRSKAQGGSAEDRVKLLQDKLKSLQSQLYQLTFGKESHGAGNKGIDNIQSQISTTIAELAEASAHAAEEKLGATVD